MKSKRAFIATVLSAMLITAAFPVAASAAGNEVLLGDVNGNGKVEVTDATMVQMIAAELTTVSAERMKAADVNGDGEVNISDATLIQQYAAEIQTGYAIGEPIETEVPPTTEVATTAAATTETPTTTAEVTTEPVEPTTAVRRHPPPSLLKRQLRRLSLPRQLNRQRPLSLRPRLLTRTRGRKTPALSPSATAESP